MKTFFLFILCCLLTEFTFGQNEGGYSDNHLTVLNYSDLNSVELFEKLELGVALPSEVATKIENFTKDRLNAPKLNPYLEWEIRVYAEFFSDSITTGPILIDGFYTIDYTSWSVDRLPKPKDGDMYSDDEYNSLGGWKEIPTSFPFRVRFAPPKTGTWKTRVKIVVENQEILESEWLSFNVIKGNDPGYITVGDNGRYLNHNSKTFFPFGCNLPWPESDKLNDPELVENLSFTDKNGQYYEGNEGYKENFCTPRVYEKYRNVMTQLADNGANYFRMIMYPSSTDIEWEKLGNYTERLAMAHELDEILNLAEEKDLFIHWNMQIHYSFQFSKHAYYRVWSWDSRNNGLPFAYKALIGTEDPIDFFTHEESKKYYKQRLRYILARWGYSTNIGVLEMFSEISNVGSHQADNADFYRTGDNWKLSNTWQKEMAAYIKSHYNGKIHLLTASYAGEIAYEDDIFADSNLDVITSNIYDFQNPSFSKFWTDNVSKNFLNTNNPNAYQINKVKPFIFSETDPIEAVCDQNAIEIQRAMWQGIFSGLAGTLSWELRKHPNVFPIFGQMKNFISNYDLDKGAWYPGASEQSKISNEYLWTYYRNFAAHMGIENENADISYLRSGDDNYVIGVITNKTYNVASTSTCLRSDFGLKKELKTIDCEEENLKLRGMHNAKYYIDYYDPSNLDRPVFSSDDGGPKVKIEYSIPANQNGFITLFVVRRKNYERLIDRK